MSSLRGYASFSALPSAASGPPHPLTTIFAPPAGCFNRLNETAGACGIVTRDDGSELTNCYISVADTCYPPSAATPESAVFAGVTQQYLYEHWYSPGVLPLGFTKVGGNADGFEIDSVTACRSGWDLAFYSSFCTRRLTSDANIFTGFLPRMKVQWAQSDLSLFTPASAPALETSAIAQYESSVFPGSRSVTPSATTTSSQASGKQIPTQPTHSSIANDDSQGLSTGAKAGIGVGVALGVLLLIAGILFYIKRKRSSPQPYQFANNQPGPISNNETRELPAEREPDEVHWSPPIPFASKPRVKVEAGGNPRHELA